MTWIPTGTLFVMMLALGMTLRIDDFRRLASAPLAIAIGLFGQLVWLPLVAFALAHVFPLSQTQAVGLVLIAACPGGVVSNVIARLARGDVALSISLTAASSIVSFLSVPFVVGLAMRSFVAGDGAGFSLTFADMASPLFLTTALPVLLGMALLRGWPALAARVQRPLLGISTGVLMLLVAGLGVRMAQSAGELSLAQLFVQTTPAVVALVAITMGGGLLASHLARLDAARTRTLALEIGLQNFNLALVVSITLLGDQRYAGPALVYLPVMFLFAFAVVAVAQRRDATSGIPSAAHID
jgi:BASS family bile acid:Na+ symporter